MAEKQINIQVVLINNPFDPKRAFNNRRNVIVKKEVLDQPTRAGIPNLQMSVIVNSIDPALQKVFDADAGCFEHGLFGRPETKKRPDRI